MSHKKVYDSLHGFIRFDEVESLLIDSLPFQRLHYIRQLGTAYLVYPGATHKRFEHSLGAMEIATRIYDRVMAGYDMSELDRTYWRRVLRLSALCHDLGHLPFSHASEQAFLGTDSHELITIRLIECEELKPVWERFESSDVITDVIKIAVGESKLRSLSTPYSSLSYTPFERVVSRCLTGDFFGADRIDYLLRDAHGTGLAYGLFDFHQLIEMMRLVETDDGLTLGIDINGIESCETLLLSRYFMHKRIYQYPSIKAYSFHLAQFMKQHYQSVPEDFLNWTDTEVLSALRLAKGTNPHAAPFFDRGKRFAAIETKKDLTEGDILNLQKEVGVPEESFSYHMRTCDQLRCELDFPTRLRSGAFKIARELTEVTIPLVEMSWIYCPAEYESGIREKLNLL